jgi:undecaprenyl-diphosphatase
MTLARQLTHLGGARVTIGVPLVFVVLGAGERRLGLAMLVANAASHLAVQVLKRLVQRPRPCDAAGHPLALVPLPDPFSFPSGHAAAATALAVTLVLAYGWVALPALLLAGGVAGTRVTLRVHHLGDVLAGVCLGVAGAILGYTIFV